MRTWIGVHRWQLACEAAVLSDKEAPLFLREQLKRCEGDEKGYGDLLITLAWFEPEEALKYYDAEVQKGKRLFVQRIWLEAYDESRLLQNSSEEERAAYAAVTALFPAHTSDVYKREWVLGIACARRSLKDFLGLSDWENYIDYFLFSKLWLAYPEELLDRVQSDKSLFQFWKRHCSAIVQVVLGKRKKPEDIPHLVSLVEEYCLQKRSISFVTFGAVITVNGEALEHTIQVLAEYAPAELRRFTPELFVSACAESSEIAAALVARLITQVARCQMSMSALDPLKNRVQSAYDVPHARRWIRQICQTVPAITSEPGIALRLMRVFRLLVIARRIEEATPKHTQRAQHWLTRSQRFIDSVEFSYWRAHLQEKLHRIQKGLI